MGDDSQMPLTYEEIKHGPQQRKRKGVFLACETCKSEFYVMPSRLRQAEKHGVTVRYCSMTCYGKHGTSNPFHGKTHAKVSIERMISHPNRPKFKADATNPNIVRFGSDYKHQESRRLRGRLLDERGARCEWCGYSEVAGVLEIHHEDRNRRNNDKANLKILCPTCHAVDHYVRGDGAYNRLRKPS
jgi:hypothetical protein